MFSWDVYKPLINPLRFPTEHTLPNYMNDVALKTEAEQNKGKNNIRPLVFPMLGWEKHLS